jgi:hypothetical protein
MPSDSDRYRRFVTASLDRRLPAILKTAAEEADAEARGRLDAIGRAIAANAPMVADLGGWPFPGWEGLPQRVNGKRVRDAAYFDVDYWFYLRILQAVRYGERRIDPFRATKHRELDHHLSRAGQLLETTRNLAEALRVSLAGNAHDLSHSAAPTGNYEAGLDLLAAVARGDVRRIDIVADNFGGEFVADLVLAIVAASRGIEVVLHVKQLPLFVSDVTADDVTVLLDRLPPDGEFTPRLQREIERGLIRFAANTLWSSPKFLDRIPEGLLGVRASSLVLLKGDLNFRRAVGDALVDPETPFEALPVRPPVPMLSLRSIRSYCLAGMAGIWPAALPKADFPLDGSIVAAQQIPAATASA